MSAHKDNATIARLMALGGELVRTPGAPRAKFDLAHMRTLLDGLGNPERRFPAVLIAGTNGKGSTASTLASILRVAGYRTGLYTSPHLEHPSERIRINGEPISEAAMAACFEKAEATASRLVVEDALPQPPSFFEAMTAIAFLHFGGEQPVEIAVLEVGLGGRLDATNVVEPLISVITDISLDHTEWLGDTIPAITREKAGILRQDGILVTLPQHPEANQALGEVAMPLGVQGVSATEYLPHLGHESIPSRSLKDALRNRYDLALPAEAFPGETILHVDSPLAGSHQQRNIALAIAAAVALRDKGFPVSREAVERGIRETSWPGRLELLPATATRPAILLDAAHNPAGAWTLRAALSALPETERRTLVFGCMEDKAIGELAQVLFPVFDEVILTRANVPRSASVESLVQAAERTGAICRAIPQVVEAVEVALAATPARGLVVVAGSIALLGEALGVLRK